jgi:hypothetical protein
MDSDHFLFFAFIFICYSFGMFSIGYTAGQQSLMERFKGTRKRDKKVDVERRKWLEEIERN